MCTGMFGFQDVATIQVDLNVHATSESTKSFIAKKPKTRNFGGKYIEGEDLGVIFVRKLRPYLVCELKIIKHANIHCTHVHADSPLQYKMSGVTCCFALQDMLYLSLWSISPRTDELKRSAWPSKWALHVIYFSVYQWETIGTYNGQPLMRLCVHSENWQTSRTSSGCCAYR